MKVKINTFFDMNSREWGWMWIKVNKFDAINLGIDDQKIADYAKKISDIIDSKENWSDTTTRTFEWMVDNTLQNPENVQKIIDLIQKEEPRDGESPLQALERQSKTMSEVMRRHANIINNTALQARERIIDNTYNKWADVIHNSTHSNLDWLKQAIDA